MPAHFRSSVPQVRRKRQRSAPTARLSLLGGLILVALFVIVPAAMADLTIPDESLPVYIQTTGPLAELGIGDYRTNHPISVSDEEGRDPEGFGDNTTHQMVVAIPCLPGTLWTFDIFDPAIDDATGIDEPRDGFNDDTDDQNWYDDTTFWLFDPTGAEVASTTYSPGDSAGAWDTLATIEVDNPYPCGDYVVETYTGNDQAEVGGLPTSGSIEDVDGIDVEQLLGLNNDDNAWRLRIVDSQNAPNLVPGPDGILGTGDEIQVRLRSLSYQHSSNDCQDFYWLVEQGDPQLYVINFDLDDEPSYGAGIPCYFPPGVEGTCADGSVPAGAIQGTRSGNTTWNDGEYGRPSFGDLETFDIPGGDLTGDATSNPPAGVWRAEICVDGGNQYSLEVPGYDLFVEPPDLPQLTIDKDDGVEIVSSPGSTSYTITITNEGVGAALPLPGDAIELTDELPSGMTFDSCTVNAPLIGTCSYNGGSGLVEVDLTGHDDYPNIILPGVNAAANSGTVTVNALVDSGLAGGTLLENVATIDYTDEFGNDYPPETDNDIDTVVGEGEPVADLSLDKSVSASTADVGDVVTYMIEVTNSGPNDTTGVTVTDDSLTTANSDYASVTVAAASPTQGSYDTATGVWTVGALAVGQSETLAVQVELAVTPPVSNVSEITSSDLPDPDSTPDNGDPGEDDQDDVTINPPGTPTDNDDDEDKPSTSSSSPSADTSTGSALITDPALLKSVTPEDAVTGETVIWTINVSNPTSGTMENVVVTDTVPSMFEVVRVSTSQGDASAAGNSITANIGTLEPGESAVINVETVANDLAAPPDSCNVAFVGDVQSNEACVNVFPEELPALGGGRPPLDVASGGLWLLFVVGAGLFLTVGWAIFRWSSASRRL